jgi:hypothetical protein
MSERGIGKPVPAQFLFFYFFGNCIFDAFHFPPLPLQFQATLLGKTLAYISAEPECKRSAINPEYAQRGMETQ